MKKILSIFCATAAIAFAASCAKEQYGSVNEGTLSKVTIAASFTETRTTITDTASVLWAKGDAVAVFDSKGNCCDAMVPESADGKTTADIEAILDESADNFYIVYPLSGAAINGTKLTLTLAAEQSSFADANAMAGTCKSSAKAITLKNLSSILSFETARTDIKSVAISGLTEDDAFPTQISLSFDGNGRYTIEENLDAAESVTVKVDCKAGRYYAGFFPVKGISGLKLTLTTDNNAIEVITVNQTLDFSAGKLINLGNIDSRIGKTYHSVKKVWTQADTTGVNALKQDSFSGKIDETGLFTYTANKGNAGTKPAFYTAKVDGVDKTAVLRLYQAPANNFGGFITLASAQGDKIAGVKMSIGSNTTIAYAVDGEPVNIADSTQCTYNGGVNITSLNASTVSIYCVSNDNNRRLQIGSIEIVYAADPRTPQTLSFPSASYEATVGQTFTSPKVSGAQTAVTYSSSDEEVATVDAASGEVTIVGAGTCTITAIAAESETYKGGIASYSLTVFASVQGIKGIKELIRAGEGAEVSFKTSVTDMIVTFVRTAEYPYTAYLEESNGQAVYFYNTAANPFAAAGEKYNGTISGKGKVYNGCCEITQIDLSKATKSTGNVPLTTVTIAELNANYAAYEYRNVKIEGATAKSALTAGDRSCTIAQGDNTMTLYTGVTGAATINEGAVIDVVCHPDYYTKKETTTYQCYIWSQDAITVKGGANTVSGLPETKNLSVGDTWTIGATCTEGEVSYSITSGSEFASLSNGVLTANAAGTVILKAESATSGIYTADEATCTITIAAAGQNVTYTLDNAAIIAAHSASWSYTSGSKNVTAADKSVWNLLNTYASKGQVTIQMNTGKGCKITTPSTGTGKKIISLTVEVNSSKDGTGTTEVTRTFDILDGETTVLSAVKGSTLLNGVAISGTHSQLSIIPNEKTGGAVYIKSITIVCQ